MNIPMRFFYFPLAAVLISLTLLAASPAQAQDASRTVSRTVDLDADGRVHLESFTGSIDVITWDRASVQIDVRIEGDDPELVDLTEIRIDGSARELTIETDYDEVEDEQKFLGLISFGNVDKPATHYTIQMPRTAALSIEDFSSTINVENLQADLSIDAFSSSIHLLAIEGYLRTETFSGSVQAEDIRGGMNLETFSGDATIRFAALTADSQFESFSGDVELHLPADAGFELAAEKGMSGDLTSDFELAGDAEANERSAIIGGGGPRIAFEAFSGDLTLRKWE